MSYPNVIGRVNNLYELLGDLLSRTTVVHRLEFPAAEKDTIMNSGAFVP